MRTPKTTGDALFDRFWAAYPKHVGKDKALKAFAKINPTEELFENILENLERQKKYYAWGRQNWKYIPHAATWLNQKRWEDEMADGEADVSEDDSPFGGFLY